MAISKTDCLVLLNELQENGIDSSLMVRKLIKMSEPTTEVLKFINDNRQLDLAAFYEKIRKSYNNKKSTLYINLMKDPDIGNINSILATLNSYALQVILFANSVNNKQIFFRFARLQEVYQCLYYYTKTYDLTNCLRLLSLIKSDIKVLETCYREVSWFQRTDILQYI